MRSSIADHLHEHAHPERQDQAMRLARRVRGLVRRQRRHSAPGIAAGQAGAAQSGARGVDRRRHRPGRAHEPDRTSTPVADRPRTLDHSRCRPSARSSSAATARGSGPDADGIVGRPRCGRRRRRGVGRRPRARRSPSAGRRRRCRRSSCRVAAEREHARPTATTTAPIATGTNGNRRSSTAVPPASAPPAEPPRAGSAAWHFGHLT